MIRWLLRAIGVVLALVLVVLLVGWSLPVRHTVSRELTVQAPPSAVYALVTDVGSYPGWRTGVTDVDVLATDDAARPLRFREHGADGAILYEVVEREQDRRVVVRIADPSLPFGGRWTYEVIPAASGTTLRITEDGEVYNPIFRFVSRFVMGHDRTMNRFLRDASVRLGAATTA